MLDRDAKLDGLCRALFWIQEGRTAAARDIRSTVLFATLFGAPAIGCKTMAALAAKRGYQKTTVADLRTDLRRKFGLTQFASRRTREPPHKVEAESDEENAAA